MSNSAAQKAYNKSIGLPGNWVPKQYLGPGNPSAPPAKTPGGIFVRHCGFKGKRKPEWLEGHRARVVMDIVDAVWSEAKNYIVNGNPYNLLPKHLENVRKLTVKPGVAIRPSIWWSEPHGFYVGGLYHPENSGCEVAVWYKSELNGGITDWANLLHHEFQHFALHWAGANMWLPDGVGRDESKSVEYSVTESCP